MTKQTSMLIAQDGHEIKIGDEVTDFRGNKWIVKGWSNPHHEGSTGRVYLSKTVNSKTHEEFYPGVINAHIVGRKEDSNGH